MVEPAPVAALGREHRLKLSFDTSPSQRWIEWISAASAGGGVINPYFCPPSPAPPFPSCVWPPDALCSGWNGQVWHLCGSSLAVEIRHHRRVTRKTVGESHCCPRSTRRVSRPIWKSLSCEISRPRAEKNRLATPVHPQY